MFSHYSTWNKLLKVFSFETPRLSYFLLQISQEVTEKLITMYILVAFIFLNILSIYISNLIISEKNNEMALI